jgi:Ankyrin repeats (3 copies)
VSPSNSTSTSGSEYRTPWWFALLGLGRAGQMLYTALFILAVPALVVWFVLIPRWRFSDQDERLFRAARHGDAAAVEQALAAGAHVNAASPVDGKTALCRAAIFGHSDAVRILLSHGADATIHGDDGQTAIDIAAAARKTEKDPAGAQALDSVVSLLRSAEARR